MPKVMRSAVVGVVAFVTMALAAEGATATVTLTSGTGNYVATSVVNQTIAAPTIFGPVGFSCSETLTLNLTAASGDSGDVIGNLAGAGFRCSSSAVVTVLGRSSVILSRASSARMLVNVPIELEFAFITGRCLFRGAFGISLDNGTRAAALPGGTLGMVSGLCSGNASVTAIGLSLDRTISYTGTA